MTNQSESKGELLRPRIETSKLADLNEDVNLKLIQLQTVLLLLAFSSLLNVTASTPEAKHHQIILLIGGLAGRSHFDDLSSRVRLCRMEQCALNCCVRVLLVCEHRRWQRVSVALPALSPGVDIIIINPLTARVVGAPQMILPPYLDSPPVCDRLK